MSAPEKLSEERLQYFAALGKDAEQRLAQLMERLERAAHVAQSDFDHAHTRYLTAAQALRDYDAESERLIAENDGRVLNLRAQVGMLKDDPPNGSERARREALIDELRAEEQNQRHLGPERLEQRRPLSFAVRMRARAAARAGVRVAKLTSDLLPGLTQTLQNGRLAEVELAVRSAGAPTTPASSTNGHAPGDVVRAPARGH